jgi:hypothetical protein
MNDTILIITKLLLAHFIGDFVLQTKTWVKQKETRKFKSFHLYIHVLIHTILPIVFVWKKDFVTYALIIGVTHFIIDVMKTVFHKRKPVLWFILDQLLHLSVIFIIGILFTAGPEYFVKCMNHLPWVYITVYLFVTTPSSIIIRNIISFWQPGEDNDNKMIVAGIWIGMIERIFVVTFIIIGYWEGVGFLLGAKSVFRFKDMKRMEGNHQSEYILLGTLLSFGFAIAGGIILKMIYP